MVTTADVHELPHLTFRIGPICAVRCIFCVHEYKINFWVDENNVKTFVLLHLLFAYPKVLYVGLEPTLVVSTQRSVLFVFMSIKAKFQVDEKKVCQDLPANDLLLILRGVRGLS